MRICVMALLFVVGAAWAIPADQYEFANEQQEQLFRQLGKELRCPKCQNQNIADSNAEIAADLRKKTYQLIQQGYDKQEVVDYMVARYGNFVTYNPPLSLRTIALWAAPLLTFFFGLFWLWRRARRETPAVNTTEVANVEQQAKALLDEVERQ